MPEITIATEGDDLSFLKEMRDRLVAHQEDPYEDTQDLAVLAERKGEPTIPHDVLIAELQADGLIKSQLSKS